MKNRATIIMPRKAAEYWWNLPINGVEREPFVCPPEVAYYEQGEPNRFKDWEPLPNWIAVTWNDVFSKRTERMRNRLQFKRMPDEDMIMPCIVWVFYVDSWLMGGYYTIIKTLKKEYYLNFRGHDLRESKVTLQMQVMQAFPMLLPLPDLFEEWMKMFAKRYRNPRFYKKRKIQGTAFAWCKLTPHGKLMAISANKEKLMKDEKTTI